jgi:uncharacterized protein YjiS (DUF1127 family)
MRNDRLRSTHFAARFLSNSSTNAAQPEEMTMNRLYANGTSSHGSGLHSSGWSRFVHALDAGVETVIDGFVTWQRRHKDRLHLMALDDRLLHDIGISAADVEHEVSKPFWKA